MKNLKLVIALAVGMMIGSIGTVFAASTGTVQAVFAEFNLIINGKPATMDTTPLVYEGTSYLPVRNMANLFGYDVTWKADSRTIEFTTATGATYAPTPTPMPTPTVTPASTPPLTPVPTAAMPQTSSDDMSAANWSSIRDMLEKFGGSSGPGLNVTIQGSTFQMPDANGLYQVELNGKKFHIKKQGDQNFVVMDEWN